MINVNTSDRLAASPKHEGGELTQRERELGAIIEAYNQVTEQLKQSHDRLGQEVVRLREELAGKNRQLRRRERLAALGELAAGVAHEIRNPLGGIQLFASLLARDLEDRPSEQRVVQKIIAGVARLESIVTDILEFGRPSKASFGEVSLARMIQEVVELAAPQIQQSRVTVESPAQESECTLATDSMMLQRALLNLVLNAVEAAGRSTESGRVEIALRCMDDENVVIAVKDNGPGIDPELLDRIFNPFFTTKDSGTGLGLAIVHQIAETLGGSVQASNNIGGGAVFSLRLPRQCPSWVSESQDDTRGDASAAA